MNVSDEGGGVMLVTLNNPARRNALDQYSFRALAALWPSLAQTNARCIVLTGAGGAFCSGADLSEDLHSLPDIDELIDLALLKGLGFDIPLVAAIEGPCVAGGLELALSCDIRVASVDAVLGMPEARWGVFPAGGGVIRLASEIGHGRASEMMLSGRMIDADEAFRIGLVTGLAPKGAALGQAIATARLIAANSPVAVRAIKKYLQAARRPSTDLAALEAQLAWTTRNSDDAREGPRAFLEKCKPCYRDLE